MTFNEFRLAFAEMTAVYGEKAYPIAMSQKLFHFVSQVDVNDFRRVINSVIMEHNRAPPIGVVSKGCFPFLKDAAAREQRRAISALEARSGRCAHCDNTAMVHVFARANRETEYAFKCVECDSHQVRRVGQGIPTWRPDLSRDYMTLTERMALEKAERIAASEARAREDASRPRAPKLSIEEREALRSKIKDMASGLPDDDFFTWGEN